MDEDKLSEVVDKQDLALATPDPVQNGDDKASAGLSFRAVNPVHVQVRNLTVQIDTTPPWWQASPVQIWNRLRGRKEPEDQAFKTILDGVSASMRPGTLTAIIGSSGSGKTSLLNMMAGRMESARLKVSGSTTFNGDPNMSHVRSAYVMQQDVLIPTLTVRETLQYSADLRLPPPMTRAERRAIVEQVIMELGLKECADTRIGSSAHKGCSGGEKRRTSIGVQMLANPSVLFCDEPTTGLDATSAYQIIRTLKGLAQKGRTVIVSIHAPRSEIWNLFDNVILLSRGSALYSGPVSESLPYFEQCGYVLPPFVNPAEFLIDLAAIDNRSVDLENASLARVDFLKQSWKARSEEALGDEEKTQNTADTSENRQNTDETVLKKVPFSREFQVLTSRTFKTTLRDPMGVAGSLLEAIGMAVINGWIFLQLDKSLAGIRSREGSLYTASSLNGYLVLTYETFRLTIDIQLFDRERSEGVVSVPGFLLSRRAARLLLEDLPVPILFAVIFYFMVGFRLEASTFFVFLGLNLLTHYIAVTFAAVGVGVSRSFPGAGLVANLSFTLQSFACGYFVQTNQIPVYVRWLKWTAYTFYIFGALCANEFIGVNGPPYGQFYDCPYSTNPLDPACKEYTGIFIMESLGFPSNWIWRPCVILVGYVIGFYLLAGLLLQYNRFAMGIAQARKSEGDVKAGRPPSDHLSRQLCPGDQEKGSARAAISHDSDLETDHHTVPPGRAERDHGSFGVRQDVASELDRPEAARISEHPVPTQRDHDVQRGHSVGKRHSIGHVVRHAGRRCADAVADGAREPAIRGGTAASEVDVAGGEESTGGGNPAEDGSQGLRGQPDRKRPDQRHQRRREAAGHHRNPDLDGPQDPAPGRADFGSGCVYGDVDYGCSEGTGCGGPDADHDDPSVTVRHLPSFFEPAAACPGRLSGVCGEGGGHDQVLWVVGIRVPEADESGGFCPGPDHGRSPAGRSGGGNAEEGAASDLQLGKGADGAESADVPHRDAGGAGESEEADAPVPGDVSAGAAPVRDQFLPAAAADHGADVADHWDIDHHGAVFCAAQERLSCGAVADGVHPRIRGPLLYWHASKHCRLSSRAGCVLPGRGRQLLFGGDVHPAVHDTRSTVRDRVVARVWGDSGVRGEHGADAADAVRQRVQLLLHHQQRRVGRDHVLHALRPRGVFGERDVGAAVHLDDPGRHHEPERERRAAGAEPPVAHQVLGRQPGAVLDAQPALHVHGGGAAAGRALPDRDGAAGAAAVQSGQERGAERAGAGGYDGRVSAGGVWAGQSGALSRRLGSRQDFAPMAEAINK
ncbi:ABC efflux transporter [Rasamsonia emersonii CBS 393.64]|uniref:ABC efflux transporter n=1 Tax=Rasamsonia emersonii (strain ATCC 16479 / CBS 393.64 / IMI 116815) TaxID=1408163 RepID=A0A0F4YZ07_RASE3|nr:ABC efflux transporter [Rasamsonia emersonii CBS 393.64]KKA23479.1 ABC efflux transporter [Rasamsonia emersonii CBS 393.64]